MNLNMIKLPLGIWPQVSVRAYLRVLDLVVAYYTLVNHYEH